MSKKEWFEAWLNRNKDKIVIEVKVEGVAWGMFWVALASLIIADAIINNRSIF